MFCAVICVQSFVYINFNVQTYVLWTCVCEFVFVCRQFYVCLPVYCVCLCLQVYGFQQTVILRVTDWLNTLTWLQHNLVCSSPQSCGGGTLIDTTKCFHSGKKCSRKQMAKWACDTIASNMCWPPLLRAGCLLRAQYNRYTLHCAQLKENPRWKKLLSYVNFYKLCRSWARQWGAI